LSALQATPWSDIDPAGDLFRALTPSFVTIFERTRWTVRKRDGSVVEVALDIGQIVANGNSTPLCELEFELLAGQPAALFTLARQIARTLAVIPEHRSKAQRGYALAENSLHLPVRAHPPAVSAAMSPVMAARGLLSEMFCQFTANLHTLPHVDDPEVVHQARVGWRRFKSTCRLFRPALEPGATPSWDALQTLLTVVGELRDLDVARTENLPQFAQAYVAGNARRQEKWQALTETLERAAQVQRKAVAYALEVPAVGVALLDITQWLEALPGTMPPDAARAGRKASLSRWAAGRMARLHKKFKGALRHADTPEGQHRIRIFSKRMRYGIEALQPILSRRRTQRWYRQATKLQTSIGRTRDLAQAHALLVHLETDPGLAEFLRGVVAAQAHQG
jgi:inorganic triphosphatase YgiF